MILSAERVKRKFMVRSYHSLLQFVGQLDWQSLLSGLTLPLITNEEGDKFGKSAGNAIWLSNEKTSEFSFYQFWMRQADADAEKMLKLFSFDTLGAVKDLMRQHHQKPELRLPQKHLAEQVTLLVHGQEGLEKAQAATSALYQKSVSALASMNIEDIVQMFKGAFVVEVLSTAGQTLLDLAMSAGCFPTKGKIGLFYYSNQ